MSVKDEAKQEKERNSSCCFSSIYLRYTPVSMLMATEPAAIATFA